jgi:uncharacterized repeat protein (TIGR01451 family)
LSPNALEFSLGGGGSYGLRWINAHPETVLRGVQKLPGVTNYLMGSDKSKWRTSVPQFGRVEATDLYPGVDIIYYPTGNHLEYDLRLAPHADAAAIRMKLDRVTDLHVGGDGDLWFQAAGETVQFRRVRSYQLRDGVESPVDVFWSLISESEVGLRVGSYDPDLPLIIDPVLSFSSPVLASWTDSTSTSVAVDSAGYIYIVGMEPQSSSAPTIFITKLDPRTSQVVYVTRSLLGAMPLALAVDSLGEVCFTGISTVFQAPVTPIHPFVVAPNDSSFVGKLNAAGTDWVFLSPIGGSNVNWPYALAIDSEDNIYIAGSTSSPDFPAQNAYQSSLNGASDGFLMKVNSTGTSILLATYFGGSGADSVSNIALDPAGNVYLTGHTNSPDLPVVNPVQDGGSTNTDHGSAFVAKFNPTASQLVYSTFLGSPDYRGGDTTPAGIVADGTGNAYVTGSSNTGTIPLVNPIANPTNATQVCFVTKLSTLGSIVFSSVLRNLPVCGGVALTGGNVAISGANLNPGYPLPLVDPLQVNPGNFSSGYVMVLDSTGSSVVFSTFLGATDGQIFLNSFVSDSSGNLYLAGATWGSNFPLSRPIQNATSLHGAFVSKIDPTSNCTFNVSPLVLSGSGSATTQFGIVSVTAPGGCVWNAVNNGPLSIFGATNGSYVSSGNDNVAVIVNYLENADLRGTVFVAGKKVTVNVTGFGCSYQLVAPPQPVLSLQRGLGVFRADSGSSCVPDVVSNNPWIKIRAVVPNGFGAYVVFEVSATATPRQGSITAGGVSYTVSQDPAGILYGIAGPVPGSALTSSNVTFTWVDNWSFGFGGFNEKIELGKSTGGRELGYTIFSAGTLSATFSGLPTNVPSINARFWLNIGGADLYIDYVYPVFTGPLQCQTNVAVTPTLRSEGYTENAGDITLICTGGSTLAVGSTIPQVDFTVGFNTAVTSRLLPVTGMADNISEAVLLIDDPGSGLSSPLGTAPFGVNAPQTTCGTPLTGCTEYVSTVTPASGIPIAVATNSPQGSNATVAGYNVFQGIAGSNAITWHGIPLLPPVYVGLTRTFRFTNLRVNATALNGGSVVATISISGGASPQITNATPTVGFVQSGLTTLAGAPVNDTQCSSVTATPISVLTFGENVPTTFRTRVQAQTNTQYAGQGTAMQNVPGAIYASESGFTFAAAGSQTGGLADFGTRLKAQFSNVQPGVRLFVSVANVNNAASPLTPPAVIGGSAANQNGPPYAQLVSSETGSFSAVSSTATATGGVPIAEIPVSNGSATAIWEVVNTNPNSNESIRFAVYATYNSPSQGAASVNLSFAPAPPAFAASNGATASSTLPEPRFLADPNPARTILSIGACTAPTLAIAKTHAGSFNQGQNGATYAVRVTNSQGASSTSGTVTVTESVPSGLTLISMNGTGWTCPGTAANNCTRSDGLAGGASYPDITVTVNVAENAASPQVNSVTVSGGGSADASTTNSADIVLRAALNVVVAADSSTVAAGSNIAFTVTVSNTNTTGTVNGVTLSDVLPSGSGINWSINPAYSGPGTCSITGAVGNQTLSCSIGDLAAGASASVHVTSVTQSASCALYQDSASASASNSRTGQGNAMAAALCPIPLPIRVNAGGDTYTDSLSQSWLVDTGYQNGSTFSVSGAIAGTTDPSLYRDLRFSPSGPLVYQFLAPNGNYTVNLKFAELFYTASGQRVFDIAINGATVTSHFDAVAAAGTGFKAVDQSYPLTVGGGLITITLTPVTGLPAINAIEILQLVPDFTVANSTAPQAAAPGGSAQYTVTTTAVNGFNGSVGFSVGGLPTGATATFNPTTVTGAGSTTMTVSTTANTLGGTFPLTVTATSGVLSHTAAATLMVTAPASVALPIRVNAGGGAYTDSLSQSWLADTGYENGSSFSVSGAIAGTNDPSLYRDLRFSPSGPLVYQFLAPNGNYTVNLKFAELFYTASGQRVFDIAINGATVTSHFDAVAAAGGGIKAVDRSYSVTVSGGLITITLTPVTGLPAINGIEILQLVPDFTLANSTPPQSVVPAGSAPYTITTSAINGFNGSVGFSVSGLPTGATATFNPTTVTGAGSTTMTISTTANTPGGSFPLTVTATSGALSHTASATLLVTAPASVALPIRVNAGGGVYTDSLGHGWLADAGFQSGSTFSVTNTIAGTADPSLYRDLRFSSSGPLVYQFLVPNGNFTVNL